MPLSREQAFDLWAPSSSPWSVWAKPVLFANHWEAALPLDTESAYAPSAPAWAPQADGTILIIADLPGALSVRVGEALVYAGFRPIPLFNAVPGPAEPADGAPWASTLVDVEPIVDALHTATERTGPALRALAPQAPPVFLLDSARRLGHRPRPGDFDNRSVSLPTDFPSASFLTARGVTRVLLLVSSDPGSPQTDLTHTLLRWQDAGLPIVAAVVDSDLHATGPRLIRVQKPRWYRAMWHNALAVLGLRRNPLGGFGGTLPYPSSG